MRLMADYLLDSDLCLPDGDPPMVIQGPEGRFALTLSNTAKEPQEAKGVLAARLVFEAESLHGSRVVADEYIHQSLNALSYATGHPFTYNSLRQIVDWTPGVEMRELLRFLETPMRDLAEPWLEGEFGQTVEHFLVVQAGARQQTALRWFRLGLATDNLEDQFSYFWFALEIAAEALKDKEKVPSACPHCRSPLYCEPCGKHPLHKKYPGQAIQALVERHVEGDGAEIFSTLQRIRHTLMHGDRISSVIDSLPCTQDEALNSLCHITQTALEEMFSVPAPQPARRLVMGRSSDVTRKKLVVTMHASVGMGGDRDNPEFDQVPNIEVSMVRPKREA